jgi:hypothetical protein
MLVSAILRPDERLSTGFSPDPVQGLLYGNPVGEGGEKTVFPGKCQKRYADHNCQDTLTGEKKHGNTRKQQNASNKIAYHQPEGSAESAVSIPGTGGIGMSDKIIGGQSADKPGNYGEADQKGEKRDKAEPLQNWFQHLPLLIIHEIFGLVRRDE